jgi:hypothetical protein
VVFIDRRSWRAPTKVGSGNPATMIAGRRHVSSRHRWAFWGDLGGRLKAEAGGQSTFYNPTPTYTFTGIAELRNALDSNAVRSNPV